MSGYSSTGLTRSAGTDRTYFSPIPAVYVTDARHEPSGHRAQPVQVPVYQAPSVWRTSTGRGGSSRLTSSVTPATVGAR